MDLLLNQDFVERRVDLDTMNKNRPRIQFQCSIYTYRWRKNNNTHTHQSLSLFRWLHISLSLVNSHLFWWLTNILPSNYPFVDDDAPYVASCCLHPFFLHKFTEYIGILFPTYYNNGADRKTTHANRRLRFTLFNAGWDIQRP